MLRECPLLGLANSLVRFQWLGACRHKPGRGALWWAVSESCSAGDPNCRHFRLRRPKPAPRIHWLISLVWSRTVGLGAVLTTVIAGGACATQPPRRPGHALALASKSVDYDQTGHKSVGYDQNGHGDTKDEPDVPGDVLKEVTVRSCR